MHLGSRKRPIKVSANVSTVAEQKGFYQQNHWFSCVPCSAADKEGEAGGRDGKISSRGRRKITMFWYCKGDTSIKEKEVCPTYFWKKKTAEGARGQVEWCPSSRTQTKSKCSKGKCFSCVFFYKHCNALALAKIKVHVCRKLLWMSVLFFFNMNQNSYG